MDKPLLMSRVTSIISEINRLTNTLYSLGITDIQRYPENFEVLSLDAAHRAEVIACRVRNLVFLDSAINKDEFMQASADAMGIEIKESDDVIEICLPCLLPKKNKWQSTDLLSEPFMSAVGAFAAKNPTLRFNHCVICFSHIYHREQPERRVRDYDNIEMKKLLDIAAAYLMLDDSGLLCDAYHTTELGDADCTKISIMDCARFPRWLEEHKPMLKTIEDFVDGT